MKHLLEEREGCCQGNHQAQADQHAVERALAEHLGLPFLPAEAYPAVFAEPGGLLPEFLRSHRVLPQHAAGRG